MISKEALRKLLLVLMTMALAGCANIYEQNLFENFDGPPSAAELSNGSAGDIAEAAQSPQFLQELRRDPDAKRRIQDRLKSIYRSDTASEEERRQAAAVSAEIELETTSGGKIVNNVVDVLLESDDGGDFSNPSTLVRNILPDSIRGDREALTEQIRSFQEAADAYDGYGTDLDAGDTPEGGNDGEGAQRATVAVIMDDLARQSSPEQLAEDIQNDNLDGYSDPTENTVGDAENPTPFRNILDAGGLTSVVDRS